VPSLLPKRACGMGESEVWRLLKVPPTDGETPERDGKRNYRDSVESHRKTRELASLPKPAGADRGRNRRKWRVGYTATTTGEEKNR
jgi:hypothetical protein